MARKFVRTIPKTPIFRREIYDIPDSYSKVYKNNGVIDLDEQKSLFYVTQFGGFRLKKIPSYFEGKSNFFSKWFKAKYENGYFHFKSNTNFISNFGNIEIQPLLRENYSEKYYEDDFLIKNNIDVNESRKIETFLNDLNEYYFSLRVNLKVPLSGIIAEDRIDLTRFNSIPHFNYKPFAGNRLFHSGPGSSYQRISSNLRPFLKINGEETTEIDISASTIQFLNIILEKYTGSAPMSKYALSQGDPYEYFLTRINSPNFNGARGKEINLDRDSFKNLIYTLIYSTLNTQKAHINRHLRLGHLNFFMMTWKKSFLNFLNVLKN
jgi:hypothetical protein